MRVRRAAAAAFTAIALAVTGLAFSATAASAAPTSHPQGIYYHG